MGEMINIGELKVLEGALKAHIAQDNEITDSHSHYVLCPLSV